MPYEFRDKKKARKRKDSDTFDAAYKIYELLRGGKQMSLWQLKDGLGKELQSSLRNALTLCTSMCTLYEVEENGTTLYGLMNDVWYGEGI